jgi:hypothetical protein
VKKSILLLVLVLIALSHVMAADNSIKPFILGYETSGTMESVRDEVVSKVAGGGFSVVGEYAPYDDSQVIVITSDELKALASESENGGFGAMIRVGLTRMDNQIQVSYTNPEYMYHIYRMKGDISDVSTSIQSALGNEQQFGPKNGLTAKQLKTYQYKIFMPRFTNVIKIADYDSHSKALSAVENGLAAGKGNTLKVYRIDIPGKKESVFGVGLTDNDAPGSDLTVMTEIDFKDYRSTAHLPYELLVTNGQVIIFDAKFRIALNFPDLAMLGDHSFLNIVAAPDDIKKSLAAASGGK